MENKLIKITLPPTRSMKRGVVYAFTDGSTYPNPGIGGWGVVLWYTAKKGRIYQRELCGGSRYATNNLMELEAIKQAVSAIIERKKYLPTEIWTDSQYCVNALTTWGDIWEKQDWHTNSGKQVSNQKLIEEIRWDLKHAKYIKLKWLKGHNGHRFNERADALANMGRIQTKRRGKNNER